ncbi:MAG: hypothetical protein H6577_14630 [Lewinellaceae bacterium]|nr:hypothetical protein [Saprospiraceae bacterium]MCB9339363.1 hypothetical protein [Lewinellaceae bacterium]
MDILIALITGLAAGLHNSTWGMYKDSPHEGFTWTKYFRSAIAGLIYGPIVWQVTGLDLSTPAGIFLLWGSVYVAERGTMEVWKTFLRTEDQSKYFIPMQLHVLGRVVESKRDRLIAAFFYVGGIALVAWGLITLWGMYKAGTFNWNPYLILILLSVGGWISAFGGAWKDAPIEGFETFKFFRSPAVAYFYAWLAANLTDNFVVILLCSLGFTIASIETYKTFFFPSRPRGKFQGKPVLFPDMLTRRNRFVPLFIACWLYVIIAGIMAFMGPHEGLV